MPYNYDFADSMQQPPARWLNCPPMGKAINKFLPVKTPLSTSYDGSLPDLYKFHPADVFTYAPQRSGEPNARIGMWIDLTKTSRYYDKKEIEARGVRYVKMPLTGHDAAPSREDIDRFVECVKDFRKTRPNDIIVVHCTHGFNRTGFLIVAYLFEEEGEALDYAVSLFAAARPSGIYKDDYLRELQTLYSWPDALEGPGRPAWENEEQPPGDFLAWKQETTGANAQAPSTSHANGAVNGAPADAANGQPAGKRQPQFMDGQVPAVTLVEDAETITYLRRKIKEYTGYKNRDFPGSQPVSLEHTKQRDNLSLLANQEYMVSWKADGMRYLVLIEDEDQVYAFDRDNNVFQIPNLRFPHRKHARHVTNTLVDAEVVIDINRTDEGETRTPRMLIYDIVKFENTTLGACNFRKRFEAICYELIDPRRKLLAKGVLRKEDEPMGVRRKDFYDVSSTSKLLDPAFKAQMAHETDGLIFQPVAGGYHAGRYDSLLKWKPQELSTVDFRLSVQRVEKQGEIAEWKTNLYVMGVVDPFAQIKALKEHRQYDGKIVECFFAKQQNVWKILRERTDKSHPNAIHTAFAVVRCIRQPITTDILLAYLRENGFGVPRPHLHHHRQNNQQPTKSHPPHTNSHYNQLPHQYDEPPAKRAALEASETGGAVQ